MVKIELYSYKGRPI